MISSYSNVDLFEKQNKNLRIKMWNRRKSKWNRRLKVNLIRLIWNLPLLNPFDN